MPQPTRAQQRIIDAMQPDRRLFYWPPSFGSHGHFQIGRRLGHYDRSLEPRVPYTTIRAMATRGMLVEVRRFNANATSSGQNAGIEYCLSDTLPSEAPR